MNSEVWDLGMISTSIWVHESVRLPDTGGRAAVQSLTNRPRPSVVWAIDNLHIYVQAVARTAPTTKLKWEESCVDALRVNLLSP